MTLNKLRNRKGQQGVQDLVPLALSVVALVIIVGISALILAEFELTTGGDVTTVNNESQQPTDTDGITDADNVVVTADNVGVQHVEDTTTILFSDSSAGTNTTLTEDVNWSDNDLTQGQYNIISVTNYNSTDGDQLFLTYDFEETTDATTLTNDGKGAVGTFSQFFSVIVIVAIAVVLFALLRVVRRAGGGGTV